ncbi:hypothetical protein SAY86_006590 [Trapa natans]|uniref:Transcription termination factor MTERF5, chloroplastic n=1 Tax=Trapa natans TaxID=22666 RepID=A0AAN7LEG8_TRANT|nr:hypothetical protein SAY86_006590 [Trapa natans]
MRAFSTVRTSGLSFLLRSAFNSRIHHQTVHLFDSNYEASIQFCFKKSLTSLPEKSFAFQAKHAAESVVDGCFNSQVSSQTLLAVEKEEAKAVVMYFLKKQGLGDVVAARTIMKSKLLIEHLVMKLHEIHKSRYLVGRELTTIEIREALIPYLESLLKEGGNILVDAIENFQDPPVREKSVPFPPVSAAHSRLLDVKKLKAMSQVAEVGPDGKLRPNVIYLMEDVGMNLDQLYGIARRFPTFVYYSVEGKIKPVIEFLLEVGVPKSKIPVILSKRPQLCGISLSENLIPTMKYLEKLGMDKKQWAKVIYRFPALLTYSWSKINSTVDFLQETGLSSDDVGKILTRYPNITSYSVKDNLRPTANYFHSLGVDVSVLLHRSPQVFGLNIETNLKPITKFFLEKGYSLEDVKTMISRYGSLYTFSLTGNLIPKWEFFLTMDYPKSELVKFPQYFGYSFEGRIKPRYKLMKESQISLLLSQLLSLSGQDFEELLRKKLERRARQDESEALKQNDHHYKDTE